MIEEKAWAKLNLNLHIIPKKIGDYYRVRFINCEIGLHDTIRFEPIKNKVNIVCKGMDIPKKINLVYKAANILKNLLDNESLGAKIILEKKVPIKAGLGGGSSDAAATIKGLIRLWGVKVNKKHLKQLADQLGKDVYYSLEGGLCEIRNDANKVTPLPYSLPKIWVIIVTPGIKKPSTEWMYKHLDEKLIGKNLNNLLFLKKALSKKDEKEILNNLFNDFELTAINYFPFIKEVKNRLENLGASKTLLAGSGLSVAAFFNSRKSARETYDKIRDTYKDSFLTYLKTNV